MQKRLTGKVSGLEGLHCKERLDRLGLLFLEQRKLRSDLYGDL